MKYKVLVLDIDGTVTTSEKIVSNATKAALLKLQEKGVKVVLASGRPTQGIVPIAKELELDKFGGYILAFNGGRIINCQTNEIIYEKTIPLEFVDDLDDISKKYNVNIVTYENDHIITEQENDKYVAIEARVCSIPIKKVDSFKAYVNFPIVKCLMMADGEYLATVEPKVVEEIGDKLNVFRSEPFFLEIMPKNIDKAYSLGKLLEKLELTKDEMIACGDGFNDLSMIKYAGVGIAMANAQEVVKEASDYVTLSNDEDGIVHVIEKYWAE
jgi:Cof subfamily protein (haloacid dehalogenase superfamily)